MDNKNKKEKKPIYKRVWFWLLVPVAFIVLIDICGVMFMLLSPGSSSNYSSNSQPSQSEIIQKNWKHNKLDFKDGTFNISKKEILNVYEPSLDRKQGGILLVGTYKNRTKKSMKASDFIDNHIQAKAIGSKFEYDLYPTSWLGYTKYSDLIDTGNKNLLPGRSTKCAILIAPDDEKYIPNKIKIDIIKGNTIYYTVKTKLPVEQLDS